MSKEKRQWASILANIDTKTKVLALIALVAEGLFLGALTVIASDQVLYALIACATILIVTIVGIVVVEVMEVRQSHLTKTRLVPTPLTPRSEFLDELINGAIQTVCRAVSLPQTPQKLKLRVFIFRKENNHLVCSHHWAQDQVREQVGKLRFDLNSDVAKKVAVVRAALDERICRTTIERLPANFDGVTGDVADDLSFVLAAPIKDSEGQVWGTVDFDAATEDGKALLLTEVSNAVMYQLARHLSVLFAIDHRDQGALA